ncbi:hypothetical protein AKJ09_09847 [Labilithrix luteola]|uniref:DUF935 family protein n=1 Tax=Labilithrix luteola TaxID=1391654 RepID=A0A0K1QBQ6_9BACT|nr:DUF935 family protein [Labilithrix luteola]AKV03184.1 hypothetical protein AKJ09_09847 [Labilithrix luteola]
MSLRTRLAALLGISTFTAAVGASSLPSLGDPEIDARREQYGGQIAQLPTTQTRWNLSDLEHAERMADTGDLSKAAQLMRTVRKDGTVAGVLEARAGGVVRLPKKFRGNPEITEALEVGHDSVRSVFDEMFPAQELQTFAGDVILLGVGVGELVPVEGRDYPVFVRLDPEFLVYRWSENRWYYRAVIGLLPITPGDGRWVLHTVGRISPWNNGLWRAIGRAWIDKEHARLNKSNWENKLANPARVAVSPSGASQKQKQSWFRAVMAWGINTVFGLEPGYDVKLLESNGVGYECFLKTIEKSDRDIVIALSGSTVLVDGGAGFSNSDIHASIRADMIKGTADGLAYTINTQGIPQFVLARWDEDALEQSAIVEWDVSPPQDRSADADSLVKAGQALAALTTAATASGHEIDIEAFALRFRIPLRQKTRQKTEQTTVTSLRLPAQGAAPMKEAA